MTNNDLHYWNTLFNKVKETVVWWDWTVTYTVRISAQSGITCTARIYINWVYSTGIEHLKTGSGFTAYNGNVSISDWDLLQVYIKSSTGSNVNCNLFKITADIAWFPSLWRVVNDS
jgi:hypothetical protein